MARSSLHYITDFDKIDWNHVKEHLALFSTSPDNFERQLAEAYIEGIDGEWSPDDIVGQLVCDYQFKATLIQNLLTQKLEAMLIGHDFTKRSPINFAIDVIQNQLAVLKQTGLISDYQPLKANWVEYIIRVEVHYSDDPWGPEIMIDLYCAAPFSFEEYVKNGAETTIC